MELLTGRKEVEYLVAKAIDKFEKETKKKINRNTNRKNYEPLAKILSDISNQLPYTAQEKQHISYEASSTNKDVSYPHRKYDITGGQIKDAYKGIVENPRPYLIDACYIYLFNVGRKGFEMNPTDESLVLGANTETENQTKKPDSAKKQKLNYTVLGIGLVFIPLLVYVIYFRENNKNGQAESFNPLPAYQPTPQEIKHLEGIWSYFTSTPQARENETDRFHKIVNNLMEVKYEDGIFHFTRHGATINHYGYMYYNSPGVISIHSYVKQTQDGQLTSPSHSLAKISATTDTLYAISATWTFESEGNSDIIGVRNIYVKEGEKGSLNEIENTPQNAACRCKIIRWSNSNGEYKDFELEYQKLEKSKHKFLTPLLDEESILLKQPKEGVLLEE